MFLFFTWNSYLTEHPVIVFAKSGNPNWKANSFSLPPPLKNTISAEFTNVVLLFLEFSEYISIWLIVHS